MCILIHRACCSLLKKEPYKTWRMCSVHYTEILRHYNTFDLFIITIFQSSKHPCLNSTHFHCISTGLNHLKTWAETSISTTLHSVWGRSRSGVSGWLRLFLVTCGPYQMSSQWWHTTFFKHIMHLKNATTSGCIAEVKSGVLQWKSI